MELIIISIAVLAIAILFMSIKVILVKDGEFPSSDIGGNKELTNKGLMCARAEERLLWNKEGGGGCGSQSNQQGGCCCGG